MRILSKQKDYYDFVQSFGQDPKAVYVRRPVNFENKTFALDRDLVVVDKNTERKTSIHPIEVYIAGYKFIIFGRNYTENYSTKTKYNIDPSELLNEKEDFLYYWGTKSSLREYKEFANFPTLSEARFYEKIFEFQREHKAPIMILGMKYHEIDGSKRYCQSSFDDGIFNPECLGEIGFPCIIDPYSIFSMVTNFVLSTNEAEIVDVSDKSKIMKAGFDVKASFRHRE